LLIKYGLTTYEYLTKTFETIDNPYDHGWKANCLTFWTYKTGKREVQKEKLFMDIDVYLER